MQFIELGDVIADWFAIQEQIGKGFKSFVYSALDWVAVNTLSTAQPDKFKQAVFKREEVG